MTGDQIVFRPESEAWRGPGAPPVDVPRELGEIMERTYREKQVCELPCDRMSEDAVILVRLLRIYANRKGKALTHQFFDDDNGVEHIRFKMRDKRQYTTDNLPRRRR